MPWLMGQTKPFMGQNWAPAPMVAVMWSDTRPTKSFAKSKRIKQRKLGRKQCVPG